MKVPCEPLAAKGSGAAGSWMRGSSQGRSSPALGPGCRSTARGSIPTTASLTSTPKNEGKPQLWSDLPYFRWDLMMAQVANPSVPQERGFAQSTNKSMKLPMTRHPRLDPRLLVVIPVLLLCFQGRRSSKMTWRRSHRIYMTTWLI